MARNNERPERGKTRRQFIQTASAITAAASAQIVAPRVWAQNRRATIFLLSDASDSSVDAPPVQWAAGQLREALEQSGLGVEIHHNVDRIREAGERIVIAPGGSQMAREVLDRAGVSLPAAAESLALAAGEIGRQPVLLITGADVRGLVYGVLEVADRVRHGPDASVVLRGIKSVAEQTANRIRSITRLFVSEIEDKPWYHDKSFWNDYLSMLAAQRFNRFSLTLGLGYDLPRYVRDAYFIFAYPFLLSVPGYNVNVPGLPADEPERNLAMLQFISTEAAARGLHFQLGVWSHTYEWIDSPHANYVIKGLTPGTHAPYCRDALRMLLETCPAIDGMTFRAHSESGIPDGSYKFWETVFAGVADCGRRVEIDLHSKGIDFEQIQMALATGQPVRVSPKLTAEHMGLPGHQAAIRERERVQPSSTPEGRSFTRYGYADYLSEDRSHEVYFRIWPGKHKVLMWADPAMAAGYGRSGSFCGSLGLELCEPLSFKGRQGSGSSPERRTYADDSLEIPGDDWRKYLYTYRVWGRHLYHPDAKPETYQRSLDREFGPAARPVQIALAQSSRILPLITSAHLPSASAMTYWPEMYTNMPIADASIPHPYGDTPDPKVFGRVSPLDPALFSPINEFVDEFLSSRRTGRYSPVDVADWLEQSASKSEAHITKARAAVARPRDPEFRRFEIDVSVHNGLGRFFAQKLRAGVAYGIYESKGDRDALRDAVFFYRSACDAWRGIIKATRGVYLQDLTFGDPPHRRGHWADRLPAMEKDLAYMEQLLAEQSQGSLPPVTGPSKGAAAWLGRRPERPACSHETPSGFHPGRPLEIALKSAAGNLQSVILDYRHVNHGEAFRVEQMSGGSGEWRHTIPADYTNSAFPLMYYFELHDRAGNAWLYPGLDADLANLPYFVVRRA